MSLRTPTGPLLALCSLLVAGAALGQVRDPEDALSVGDGSGPVSEISTNVGDGSRAVHDGALWLESPPA